MEGGKVKSGIPGPGVYVELAGGSIGEQWEHWHWRVIYATFKAVVNVQLGHNASNGQVATMGADADPVLT